MLLINGAEKQKLVAGFVLLECAAVQAECLALFNAASGENRIKHLDGFRGAAFFASTCGRFLLEYVLWTNSAALAAAKAAPIFFEHIRIAEAHSTHRFVSFSSTYEGFGAAGMPCVRGDRFAAAIYKPRVPVPPAVTLNQLRAAPALAGRNSLLQVSEDGVSAVLLSSDAIDPDVASVLSSTFGEPEFRDDYVVVESITAPREGERFDPPYHLAPAAAQT
jgi:hypothetical protein